jgi:hypothetical protein
MTEFLLCIDPPENSDLEDRKVYRRLSATPAEEQESLVRVVDESGEDYLYPAKLFVPIMLPPEAIERLTLPKR